MNKEEIVISVVGLGYVGLPLAVAFGKKYRTIGFDVSRRKIESYLKMDDPSDQLEQNDFIAAQNLIFTNNPEEIGSANFIIIAVPTPVNDDKVPDFKYLESASKLVGENMRNGSTVVFESTVFPGATEEVCIPLLEEYSGLSWKRDFFVGYSPERIDPGDKERTIEKIVKVVSGDTSETLSRISSIYDSVIEAGIYEAKSIKVAEAAKVIENSQRDLNIAFVNELSKIFRRVGIDTVDVLDAASTKWNFQRFTPGLVGGHCIGVDPYYLTYKAQELGYYPKIILSGRDINDSMHEYIYEIILEEVKGLGKDLSKLNVALFGITFKENCPDMRNSKAMDLYKLIKPEAKSTIVIDSVADKSEAKVDFDLKLNDLSELQTKIDIAVISSPHDSFIRDWPDIMANQLNKGALVIDIKSALDRNIFKTSDSKLCRI